ncbi:unnamed protein product [Acanthoscelides obtectus]|nr:unnamed protein product [Acanthoscelides obtectus]CAK1663027.1 hypothetical protein AOBTE_LOCUS23439 [Acanthoscelides obtectus]
MTTPVEITVIRGPEHVSMMYDEQAKVRVLRAQEPEDPGEDKRGAFEYMDAGDLVLFWIEIMLLIYIFCFVLTVMILVIYMNTGDT